MKKACMCLAVALLAGCSASPSRLAAVSKEEASRLAAPSRPLSAFGGFELKPMELSAGISERKEKVQIAGQLESKLRTKLLPLLKDWEATGDSPRTAGVLLIQPKLVSLRVISGGARFWAGAWSGDSVIDMNLELTDRETGTIIANPRLFRTTGGTVGAWSVGATDRNLLDYIVEIAHQYLVHNYKE